MLRIPVQNSPSLRLQGSAPPTTWLSSHLPSVTHLIPVPFTDTWAGADSQACVQFPGWIHEGFGGIVLPANRSG